MSYLSYQGSYQSALHELRSGDHIATTRVIAGDKYVLTLKSGEQLFLKLHPSQPSSFFKREADNLLLLAHYSPLRVPTPLVVGTGGSTQYIIMEYLQPASPTSNYWEHCGQGLAALHRSISGEFGLQWDNWIGTTPQLNTPTASWSSFFAERRLRYQLNRAVSGGYLSQRVVADCRYLIDSVAELVGEPQPSLVHGDLWSGNVIVDSNGLAALIDPAVYFADREVDIAMSMLFGGFGPSFYASYHQSYPLPEGWQQRVGLYNLYHVLNHLNIFGTSYRAQVESLVAQQIAIIRLKQ